MPHFVESESHSKNPTLHFDFLSCYTSCQIGFHGFAEIMTQEHLLPKHANLALRVLTEQSFAFIVCTEFLKPNYFRLSFFSAASWITASFFVLLILSESDSQLLRGTSLFGSSQVRRHLVECLGLAVSVGALHFASSISQNPQLDPTGRQVTCLLFSVAAALLSYEVALVRRANFDFERPAERVR